MPEDVYTHGRLLRLPEGKTVIGDDRGIAIASDPPPGTITVALEYRPNTTGTASAGGGYLTVTAVRTA